MVYQMVLDDCWWSLFWGVTSLADFRRWHGCHSVVIWGWVKTLVPSEPQVIAGLKWMFIPLKMVLIGIDPYPFVACFEISPPAGLRFDQRRSRPLWMTIESPFRTTSCHHLDLLNYSATFRYRTLAALAISIFEPFEYEIIYTLW